MTRHVSRVSLLALVTATITLGVLLAACSKSDSSAAPASSAQAAPSSSAEDWRRGREHDHDWDGGAREHGDHPR
jgi:hypothetical protein